MTRVTINVPPRPYDAVIESGIIMRAGTYLREVLGEQKKLFALAPAPVRRKWGKKLMASLAESGFAAKLVEMPDGERHKKLATVEQLGERLVALGVERSALLLAFGGGVTGDMVGFLASIYLRGVDVVQIPTTVQAQVDAAIGGKTGVNLRAGKNLLGTFHQPRAVLIDPAVLSTLPDREFRAGMYESLKAGIIGNPPLFERLEKGGLKALRRDAAALEWVIAESVRLKAEVVSADEREGGLRRVLNLGHTIGHALETETNYRHFLHGEAVAWGMIAAANIAEKLTLLHEALARRIVDSVLAAGPLPQVEVRSQNILRRLQADKKTRDGVVHFVLPRAIGKVEIVNNVPEKVVLAAVDELRTLSARS